MRQPGLSLAAGLLLGCASLRPGPPDPGPLLLAPSQAGFKGRLLQSLTLTRDGKTVHAQAVLEVDEESVRLVGLGPLGQTLLRLSWDGRELTQEADPSLPADLPAASILRDVMLAYWPEEALQGALSPPWRLEVLPQGRRILHGSEPWLEIDGPLDGPLGSVRLRHHRPDYEILVETLKDDGG